MEVNGGYCIDSDILIDYLRGMETSRVFLREASSKANLYISTIGITEIFAGKETKDPSKMRMIEGFLMNFHPIEINAVVAKFAGELRRDYASPFADAIVAASALIYNLSLVTRNVKHYERIKDLRLVKPY